MGSAESARPLEFHDSTLLCVVPWDFCGGTAFLVYVRGGGKPGGQLLRAVCGAEMGKIFSHPGCAGGDWFCRDCPGDVRCYSKPSADSIPVVRLRCSRQSRLRFVFNDSSSGVRKTAWLQRGQPPDGLQRRGSAVVHSGRGFPGSGVGDLCCCSFEDRKEFGCAHGFPYGCIRCLMPGCPILSP